MLLQDFASKNVFSRDKLSTSSMKTPDALDEFCNIRLSSVKRWRFRFNVLVWAIFRNDALIQSLQITFDDRFTHYCRKQRLRVNSVDCNVWKLAPGTVDRKQSHAFVNGKACGQNMRVIGGQDVRMNKLSVANCVPIKPKPNLIATPVAE